MDRFGGSTLYWDRAVQGPVSNVYWGAVAQGSWDDPSCMISTTWDSQQAPQLPQPGQLLIFLVGAENECGPGSLGLGVGGTERMPSVACAHSPAADFDFDGVVDLSDNCAQWPNAGQEDDDLDWAGNACDNCAAASNPDQADCNDDGEGNVCDTDSDCDADGEADADDNCPEVDNPLQEDADLDMIGDACDFCPNDPDNDIDADGICGDVDPCPLDFDNDIDGDTVCGDAGQLSRHFQHPADRHRRRPAGRRLRSRRRQRRRRGRSRLRIAAARRGGPAGSDRAVAAAGEERADEPELAAQLPGPHGQRVPRGEAGGRALELRPPVSVCGDPAGGSRRRRRRRGR